MHAYTREPGARVRLEIADKLVLHILWHAYITQCLMCVCMGVWKIF